MRRVLTIRQNEEACETAGPIAANGPPAEGRPPTLHAAYLTEERLDADLTVRRLERQSGSPGRTIFRVH